MHKFRALAETSKQLIAFWGQPHRRGRTGGLKRPRSRQREL